ncbi:MAG: tetratricopeptide repeat protein [Candidatus Latescibacteria bacterium]|nr:tetratricopeptide repeat protein [Candidatus Latescibacterota bacterium]
MARRRITRREIKEDRFIQFIYSANDYIAGHVQEILIGVGVVVIASVAGAWFANSRQASDEAAARLLAPAQTAMQNNRTEDAIPIYQRILTDHGGAEGSREATLGLANAFFRTGNTDEAKRYYEKYISDYGSGFFGGGSDADVVLLGAESGVAACEEQEGKYLEAAIQYRTLAETHPDVFLAPQFLIDAGRCYQAAERTSDARSMYEKVVSDYEDSRYVRDARAALTML